MLFKLALWVALVFFAHGSQFQMSVAGLICIVQLVVNAKLAPFRYATQKEVPTLYCAHGVPFYFNDGFYSSLLHYSPRHSGMRRKTTFK